MKKVLRLNQVNAKVLRVLNDLGYEVLLCNKIECIESIKNSINSRTYKVPIKSE